MSEETTELSENTPDQAETIDASHLVNLYGAARIPPPRKRNPREPRRFESGTVLSNRFRIIRFLGSGGMGEVYEAQDLLLKGPAVALKTISATVAGSPGAQERFEHEILLARQVTHPNVCPIYDIFYHDCGDQPGNRVCFLCMKLLHGETMAARLDRQNKLDPDEAVAVARQIAAALHAAHKEGIVHGDVKPANIMLEGAGAGVKAVVTDFGLARKYDREASTSGRTQVAGTPGYLAPELLKGHRPSAASDLYAFGVVLREMFHGRNDTPSALLPSKAAFISPLIAQCLGDDPQRRSQAFERAKSDFEADSAVSPIAFPSQLSRRKLLGMGAASTGCALLVGAVWKWDEVVDSLNPLPRKRFVALVGWPEPANNQLAFALSGIIDAMEKELTRAEAFDRNLLVLSAPVVGKQSDRLNQIRDALGANLVLVSSAESDAETVRLSLKILGENVNQVLRKRVVTCRLAELSLLPGKAVQAAAELLGVSKYVQSDQSKLAPETSSAEAYKAFQTGEALLKKPNDSGLDDAIEQFKTAIELDSNFALAHARLAMAYGRYYVLHPETAALDLAQANAHTSLSLNSNNPLGHLALGWVFEQRGQKETALAEMNRALALDPTNPTTLIWLAQVYRRMNQYSQAEDLLQRLLQVRPNHWLAYNELGEVYNRQGKYQEALQAYRSASLAQPKNTLPLNNIGEVSMILGRLAEAQESLERSLAQKPSAIAAANLAEVLRLEGRHADAVKSAQTAVSLDPSDSESWLELGDCYSELPGHAQEAHSAYARAASEAQRRVQVDTSDGPGFMLLALYQAKTGKPDAARLNAEKAETLGATDLDSQLCKARILEITGQREAALVTLAACFQKGATRFEIASIPDLESLRADARYRKMFGK